MPTITDSDIEHLILFVKANYGIDLSRKRTFVEIRLQKCMNRFQYDTYPAYFQFLTSDMTGTAMSDFVSSLLVNFTSFYREAMHFDFLIQTVLPDLKQALDKEKMIYSWSAGCSTGEEPYTIAMIFRDFFNIRKEQWDTRILATDVSDFSLEKARAGTYPLDSVAGLSPLWLNSYFVADPDKSGKIQVAPAIKADVEFRKHNLVGSPFIFRHKFHFIFCRNVMIYFNESTKNRLLQHFYDALEDGGYLFIGMSERIDKANSPFVYVNPSIYRKVVGTCKK
ncbi:MAG: CheR family methyltransferase [Lachnospiraceae bacterium]